MNKNLLPFISGVIIGSLITKYFVTKKLKGQFDEELKLFRKEVREKLKTTKKTTDNTTDPETSRNDNLKEATRISKDEEYFVYPEDDEYPRDDDDEDSYPEERDVTGKEYIIPKSDLRKSYPDAMKPKLICEEDVGFCEDWRFDHNVSELTFYRGNSVVIDEDGEIVNDVDVIFGESILKYAIDCEELYIHIRNPRTQCDYSVLLVDKEYTEEENTLREH